MQSVISREAQNAKDEMDAVTRIAKSAPGEPLDSDFDSDDISLNSDDNDEVFEKIKLLLVVVSYDDFNISSCYS